MHMPLLTRVKIEPGVQTIYEVNNDSSNEAVLHTTLDVGRSVKSPSLVRGHPESSTYSHPPQTSQDTAFVHIPPLTIIDSLRKFGARKRSRNVLSQIDYTSI